MEEGKGRRKESGRREGEEGEWKKGRGERRVEEGKGRKESGRREGKEEEYSQHMEI